MSLPRQKRICSSRMLFAVALIAVAIISGLIVYFVMKANEPETYWSKVINSPISNADTWTSPSFLITRKMGLAFYAGVKQAVENAECSITVYDSANKTVWSGSLEPSLTITEIYNRPGTFHITVQISGTVPDNQYDWSIVVFDQLIGP